MDMNEKYKPIRIHASDWVTIKNIHERTGLSHMQIIHIALYHADKAIKKWAIDIVKTK